MTPKERLYHKIHLTGVKFDIEAAAEFAKMFDGISLQKDVIGFIGKYPLRSGFGYHYILSKDIESGFLGELPILLVNKDYPPYEEAVLGVFRSDFEEWHRKKAK